MVTETKIPKKLRFYTPYTMMLGMFLCFVIFAFIIDTPREIAAGLWRIITSRSVLITDYTALGGIGATLINSAVVGCTSILLVVVNGIKPNGAIIMALWMSTGFAFFGKNVFNMLPITFGVWLFARYQKEPFKNYALASLLCATLSPVVSEITFLGALRYPLGILWGVLLGMFVGFIFPSISSSTVVAHGGYCLYNMGFAGGLIATFVVSVMNSLGVGVEAVEIWSRDHNVVFAVFLYLISAALVAAGIALSEKDKLIHNLKKLISQPGRLVTDFYLLYKESVYINMGILCAMSTTIVLLFGGNLNGPTIGAIFTIIGFGSFGKHLRNVLPVMLGAILSTYFNTWDPRSPANTLAILFSSGLAPIAGQFGWLWGIVAGFAHVNLATHVVSINSGLNLYNNGFAAGLVAMLLVPLINTFRKDDDA